jgi:hypothetical protein
VRCPVGPRGHPPTRERKDQPLPVTESR